MQVQRLQRCNPRQERAAAGRVPPSPLSKRRAARGPQARYLCVTHRSFCVDEPAMAVVTLCPSCPPTAMFSFDGMRLVASVYVAALDGLAVV